MALDGCEHKHSPVQPDSLGYGSETLLLLSAYDASFVPCGTVRFHSRVLTLLSPVSIAFLCPSYRSLFPSVQLNIKLLALAPG